MADHWLSLSLKKNINTDIHSKTIKKLYHIPTGAAPLPHVFPGSIPRPLNIDTSDDPVPGEAT